jgi:hypothetical protein
MYLRQVMPMPIPFTVSRVISDPASSKAFSCFLLSWRRVTQSPHSSLADLILVKLAINVLPVALPEAVGCLHSMPERRACIDHQQGER